MSKARQDLAQLFDLLYLTHRRLAHRSIAQVGIYKQLSRPLHLSEYQHHNPTRLHHLINLQLTMLTYILPILAALTTISAIPMMERDNSLTDEINALNAANTANDRYAILGADGLVFDFLGTSWER